MQTVTVSSNTTLFHVAALLLGDPIQWSRLAAINALNDPLVHAGMTLLIPPPLVGQALVSSASAT